MPAAARSGVVLMLACAISCAPAAASPGAPPPPGARAGLLARLARLNQSEQFLFGQENATLWGMYLDGGIVPTSQWFERTARAGRFTSDSAAVVGDDPAVLGVGLGMLAFEPTSWNRREAIAEAIRRQVEKGGVVTMDWHVPSCNAEARSAGALGKVTVGDRQVVIEALTGGSSFYAEDEYTRPITSRADVPEPLKCVCQIANDRPLTGGIYKGTTGMTWLIAQAKHAAQVMREQRLAGLPIIVRPFHEQTGSWFWWGQPYWNCAALLGDPGAVSGAEAFKAMTRAYITALRSEPGMSELVFAYSPDRLLGAGEEEEHPTPAQRKLQDPTGFARDRLRKRLGRELEAAGLAYLSPAQRGATLRASQAGSVEKANAYVAQRRPFYAEAYAGDDVFDLLGIDLYHPIGRPAGRADLKRLQLQLRVLAEEAAARGKPYALTEAGSYRLQLLALAAGAPRGGRPLILNGKKDVEDGLARLFDPADRAALLRNFGLRAAGPVVFGAAERAAVAPAATEDWFNRQLLVLARQAKVAYALVWQTYYDAASSDHYFYYYVPYPGHPEAEGFRRFHADPATCFLRDACALQPTGEPTTPAVDLSSGR
jgi:hypothetical protein